MRTLGYAIIGLCLGLLVAGLALVNEIGCCSDVTTDVVAGVVGAPFSLFGIPATTAAVLGAGMTAAWNVLASRSYRTWSAGLFAATLAIHYAAIPLLLLWPESSWRWGATRVDDVAMLVCMPIYLLVHGWLWLVFVVNQNRR